MVGRLRKILALLAVSLATAAVSSSGVAAQLDWRDLVFTGGISGVGYWGNLPAITVSAVDSTKEASAVVGEFGVRGTIDLLRQEEREFSLRFDGGLRQFAAGGFKYRDYAPKELVGRVDLSFRETMGSLGELWFDGGLSGRRVDDRPPMPLFIQPGYGTVDGRIRLHLFPLHGVYYDVQAFGEAAEYWTTDLTPQLALLDRQVLGAELGATWENDWNLRFYTGFKVSKYQKQGTFDPTDPLRQDRTFNLGATWTYQSSFVARLGAEGALNRSNSSRPEYDALRVQAFVLVPVPMDVSLSFSADITAKRYLTESEYAQLVPGEEADNASIVYLEASRPLYENLESAFRIGWTRAEENIGDSYFERFGISVLFRYRPWR
jgi:hypothetical protein